jgi:hypothetical protein
LLAGLDFSASALDDPDSAIEHEQGFRNCVGISLYCNSRLSIRPARNSRHAGSCPMADNLFNVSCRLDWNHLGGVGVLFFSRVGRYISDRTVLGGSTILDDRCGIGLSSMVCRFAQVVAEVHEGGHVTIGWSGLDFITKTPCVHVEAAQP